MEAVELGDKISASERAFRLDSNEIAVVKITRMTSNDENNLTLVVTARLVDANGETLTLDDGKGPVPLQLPVRAHSIHKDVLAEGATTVEDEMSKHTVDACDRMLKHATALRAWVRVPHDS